MSRAMVARIALAAAGVLAVASGALAKEWPLDPPRIESSDTQAQRDWASRYLDQDDWALASFANGQFWLVSTEVSAHNAYPKVQDWIRIENGGPYGPKLHIGSTLVQVEVDCASVSYTPLRFINYRNNNLRGQVVGDTEPADPKPEKMSAGSIGEAAVKQICDGAAPATEAR